MKFADRRLNCLVGLNADSVRRNTRTMKNSSMNPSSNSPRNAFESLESRQHMTAVKSTDVVIIPDPKNDSTKNNGNDLVVKFNGPIKSFDISKMRMFGYANNT